MAGNIAFPFSPSDFHAGPLYLTLDVMFDSLELPDAVAASGAVSAARIAALYDVAESQVRIAYYPIVYALKITIPRKLVSGTPGDMDIYGGQQHMPLAGLPIPIREEEFQ